VNATPRRFVDCEACVDHIIERTGKRIVLGLPLGIGKPNALANALYRRARADAALQLDIITALSLNPPRGKSELEERLLRPIRERVWGDYPRLEFLDDRMAGALPANVRVLEFYMQSGSMLGNAQAQQDYISSNYTHVARDMLARGVNLMMQEVALREDNGRRRLSLSSNPDVTLQVLPLVQEHRSNLLTVVQVNRHLPWLGNAAEIAEGDVDVILDNPSLDHAPFSVPHEPVTAIDWVIGLRASALVRDGGTLQVGIGALGDAACHALRLRERDNGRYAELLDRIGRDPAASVIGGDARFETGLYVASELISNALFSLFEDGIVRRRVYESVEQQTAANADPAAVRNGGTALQGAFFIGPADFYRRLRGLGEEQRALIDMTSVAEVNRIYTHYALERLQRRHPRFINITMKVTLLGAAASDQVANGQVVSGVGGQNDFVIMAHQLPEGRSILMFRAVRGSGKKLESNVVWEYPHATIPRHMRDIYVTEYGVADLRGRSDRECIEAMLAIADSRFQPSLQEAAQRAGKLPRDYRIPEPYRNNLPTRLASAVAPFRASGVLPDLPFGCDLTADELALAQRLQRMKSASSTLSGRLQLLRALLRPASSERADVRAALRHLKLDAPGNMGERGQARLVRAAFAM
jgi:acyl-CoA hydrolase